MSTFWIFTIILSLREVLWCVCAGAYVRMLITVINVNKNCDVDVVISGTKLVFRFCSFFSTWPVSCSSNSSYNTYDDKKRVN